MSFLNTIGHVYLYSCRLIIIQYHPISLQYRWLWLEQPISIWLSTVHSAMEIYIIKEDNSNIHMPCVALNKHHWSICFLLSDHSRPRGCWQTKNDNSQNHGILAIYYILAATFSTLTSRLLRAPEGWLLHSSVVSGKLHYMRSSPDILEVQLCV